MPIPRPNDGKHTVRAGEWVSSIAHAYGIEKWDEVWTAAENSDLKNKRDPYVLAPGDKLIIPELGTKKDDAATTKLHTYKLEGDTDVFRVRLMGDDGAPLDGVDVFCVAETTESYAKWPRDTLATDGDGYLEFKCPRTTIEVRLEYAVLDSIAESTIPCRVCLRVGHLRPMRDDDSNSVRIMGVQARLRALGFNPGPLDGILGPLTLGAIRAFRAATSEKDYRKQYGLDAALKDNGRIDKALTDTLRKAHGS